MSDPFVGEIRMLATNFAPKGWAQCNGQLMPISQNTALFSLLGTTYGGDGKSTFALPDLSERVPMHPEQGQGLSQRYLGEMGGTATVTMAPEHLPPHTHQLMHSGSAANTGTPSPGVGFGSTTSAQVYTATNPGAAVMPYGLAAGGGGQPHNNMQPYLTVMFCIALQGVFPPRT